MQLLKPIKFLQKISQRLSPRQQKPSAETFESEVSDMQENELIIQSTPDANEESALTEKAFLKTEEGSSQRLTDDESPSLDEKVTAQPSDEVSYAENTTSHLSGTLPRAAAIPGGSMTKAELRELRQLFSNITDAEIQRLYKTVTK